MLNSTFKAISQSYERSLKHLSQGKPLNNTRVAALLDTLSPVRDARGWVSWIDDVALVARRTVQRLISILSSTAGLS